MQAQQTIGLLNHLTHKGNLKHTRYGWLRLTPAYSVHLVSDLLNEHQEEYPTVLDPFCGTGTTALVCAERGITCETTEINPFLIWLTQAKTRPYETKDIEAFESVSARIIARMSVLKVKPAWLPPLFQIEKWWDEQTLNALGRAMEEIRDVENIVSTEVADLLKVAFCRVMIERANVSFGHQSMSFKKSGNGTKSLWSSESEIVQRWKNVVATLCQAARSPVQTRPQVYLCDAREMTKKLPLNHYSCVITSPPYPNRMSYIRELRPYMYWLGYLENARDAGELDWKAIGGTWGCATSNVGKWKPEKNVRVPFEDFDNILDRISEKSPLLSNYVHKYFCDMVRHVQELFSVTRKNGTVYYTVGNSKFYDVMLPVESIFAGLFEFAGFKNISIRKIRKRTSKKELFEFVVSAQK